jgi:hypothetical protein
VRFVEGGALEHNRNVIRRCRYATKLPFRILNSMLGMRRRFARKGRSLGEISGFSLISRSILC